MCQDAIDCLKQSTVKKVVEMTPEMDTWDITRSIKFAQVPLHVIVPVQCVKMQLTVRNDQLKVRNDQLKKVEITHFITMILLFTINCLLI
jgi:hypothetical protein